MDTATPSVDAGKLSAPNATQDTDPLVTLWVNRIKGARTHWSKFHKRVRHNRKLVRGIDDSAEPDKPGYNKHRANLIQSTITVVLSKVYAKNPEMSGEPTNKARDLRLFAETLTRVTQTMLESAQLKQRAKATVRAAMTCHFGVVKVLYTREMKSDPIVAARLQDTQDNIARIESLLKDLDDPQQRCDEETKLAELRQAMKALEQQPEVVAAEGLVVDRVRTDRLLVDPAVEDIWEYQQADWMVHEIPMRKSKVQAMCQDLDLSTATTYKVGDEGDSPQRRGMYAPATSGTGDDPIVMVQEVWSRLDNTVYTLVDGCTKQFARKPYTPKYLGERWYPFFILPFQSVDGEFTAQSLVDVLEKLQQEHNETRDKFAEVRRTIKPHFIFSADVKDKDVTKQTHAEIGEYTSVNTGGQPLNTVFAQAQQLTLDPAVYDTTPIRNDWEMVSGLSDAARSVVVQPKTATEASISDQSLAARISEFRDQIEDWLTEIAQWSSECCLLAMEPGQVEQIMGAPTQPDPEEAAEAMQAGMPPPAPAPTYYWPTERTPETVFNLVQLSIRAGSTAAPNRLQMQENWTKALPLIQQTVQAIRAIEAAGGDATPERELLKETASRFDETIDVERFLPPKRPLPLMATGGVPGGVPGVLPAGAVPQPSIPTESAGVMPGGHVAQVPVTH